MEETEFNALAEAALSRIEQALDACDAGLDYEPQPGGVLEIEFGDGSKIIINRHAAAREIWVAARSGGFHFRHDNGRWVGTRDGVELFDALGRLASEQAGERIVLA
ncbi:MAG: iron donor protein CyaY [Burkholderiales bacterium]|jgi:CyaY protein|uniref:Iron-sulfur cluster assembly protein CyaY n=1 Tax=Candidatus Desulfobacillus denitrificans TaxID=2608985 RepID=A0A809R5Q6_9PROT|nr:iron donor protein CyaY [Zoogloeaceae bacterium]MBP9653892.1 iron donor protein CyaY [Rhodocyclaceae bacterium]MCZ2173182.1 iron donor protein CyaY [Burkholderiales bacterium]OQY73034.1 MAG: iron donor protein CyaY [Rhodocyclaceae bacterium UTPRO2]BBO22018.1 iron donor protein CyaY [Candidatus Desulfobacillus denitrificans]